MFTKHPRHPCQSQVKDGKDSMQQPPNFAVAYHVKRFVVAQSLTVCLETSMYLELRGGSDPRPGELCEARYVVTHDAHGKHLTLSVSRPV